MCNYVELLILSPALLMRSGYCVELSTSSSSCSSMTLHWRRYGVSLAGLRMRVSLCRTPSTRSQSSSQRSSDQRGEGCTSSWVMPSSSAQTPARRRKIYKQFMKLEYCKNDCELTEAGFWSWENSYKWLQKCFGILVSFTNTFQSWGQIYSIIWCDVVHS